LALSPSLLYSTPPTTSVIYILSLHDALPICSTWETFNDGLDPYGYLVGIAADSGNADTIIVSAAKSPRTAYKPSNAETMMVSALDRKSTRLNSSHVSISYAVFCLKKKKYKSN